MDLRKGGDEEQYDYCGCEVEGMVLGMVELSGEEEDIMVIDVKKEVKWFIEEKEEGEEMIREYMCYQNGMKRWEWNEKEREMVDEVEI